MGKSLGIVNLISVLFFAALLVGYMNYITKERDEVERLKLSYAIDFASDAGTEAMLGTSDMDMDYTKEKYFSVNPDLALDTFLEVFCLNYGLFPDEKNKASIMDYIPVAAVAGYDGYYIASHQVLRTSSGIYPGTNYKDSEWGLTFEMKRPYHHFSGGVDYALNMGLTDPIALTGNQLYRHEGMPPNEAGTAIMTKTETKALINKTISGEMARRIEQTNESNPNWKHQFFIPEQLTTLSGVNPIEGPSFLVLVQNIKMNTTRPISGFSVAGTSVEMRRMVAGYVRDGVKYYTYADNLPAGNVADEMFYSVNEAANMGYFPDIAYLESKKPY
ncbi:hypothetical protein ACFQZE_10900 [Paenibacillus sp. GCM10027627]|uniref:hypothetical protein n=1 Tax=unclassified Paenibacillus TaxID=185978 RepID=UPI003631243F